MTVGPGGRERHVCQTGSMHPARGREVGYDEGGEACTPSSAVPATGHGGSPGIKAGHQEPNNGPPAIRQ